MLSEMFTTSDEARVKEITQQLMTLSSHLCGYYSVLEKAAPMRIYDPKLSLADTDMNELQQNYMYFGNLNNILNKMIAEDQLYFVK